MKELQSRNVEVIAVAPFDEWSHQFNNLGVEYFNVPIGRRTLNPFVDIALLLRLYRIYRAEQPDAVLHNTIKPVIYGSIAARYAKAKLVVNMIPGLGYIFTGNGITQRFLRPIVKWMYKIALKGSRRVLFQNPDDKEYFEQNELVENQLTEVTYGSGVDLDHFYYVEPNPRKGVCTFLLLGRMLWDKGVGEFVEGAEAVKQLYADVKFQLLGRIDKDNPAHIDEKVITEWNHLGYVEYLGEVADVRNAIERADVVVLPSYYREGIPKALLEAMAMGKPIITTDMPGCRETVVGNLNGILIPARNTKALTDAMCMMINDPRRRMEMGREGRKVAVDRFDVKRVNREILEAMNI